MWKLLEHKTGFLYSIIKVDNIYFTFTQVLNKNLSSNMLWSDALPNLILLLAIIKQLNFKTACTLRWKSDGQYQVRDRSNGLRETFLNLWVLKKEIKFFILSKFCHVPALQLQLLKTARKETRRWLTSRCSVETTML